MSKPTADKLREAVTKAEAKGITRYRIAKASGVSQKTLANLLDGTTPRLDIAEKIADAIGWKIDLTRRRR